MFSQTPTINKHLKPTKSHAQDSIPSFIRKTYDILEEAKFPDIIDWNPEGTAIVIKKPADFCSKVLPQYFKHNNLTSFVRQLNMYNFHKRRTQNIDHVYAHELFQRGKKHLLKEIRRKNHQDNSNSNNNSQIGQEKTPLRLPDSLDMSQNPTDMNAVAYENHFLKKLYNEAMSRLTAYEAQVNDLISQNQKLYGQLMQQRNDNGAPLKTQQQMTIKREESELTLDKLPMTCGGISIPPLKLNLEKENTIPNNLAISKIPSMGVNKFLNLGEESTETGESPSVQNATEVESIPNEFDGFNASLLRITPQVSQINALRTNNELRISRHEMSIGQLLEAWNVDLQDNGLLGKREATNGVLDFNFDEPALKKHELSVFKMKSLFSNKSNGLFNVNDDFGADFLTFTN